MATNKRNHYWMVTSLVTFTEYGETKQSHLNGMIETPLKSVSTSVLQNVTNGLLQRVAMEAGDKEDFAITGHTFLNVCYLGQMTSDEFYDLQGDT